MIRSGARRARWRPTDTARRRRCALAFVLAAGVALSACTTLMPAPVDARVEQSWHGRFALTVTLPDQPSQSNSGNFTITRGRAYTQLDLSTPLGNVIASARSGAGGASLVTADGRRVQAEDPEQLTEQLFGWRVPFQRLPDWLAGRPETVLSEVITNTGERRPLLASDQGWQLNYGTWGAQQPERLAISFPDRVNLRLVLSAP